MERLMNFGCVILAIIVISLNVNTHAQPVTTNDPDTNLPPLLFPKENATLAAALPPLIFPVENATVLNFPPLLFPKTNYTGELADVPPLIFPKLNGSAPLVELPPLIFPDDNKRFTAILKTNETALKILNAVINKETILLPDVSRHDDYYNEKSIEQSESSEQVEEVQANDKNRQTDELEENYKSKTNSLPIDNLNDDTEVDHPMLKNTHIMSVIAAALAALCACIYIGLTIWRRIIFNRYGMRERLINEDDFYSNKSINRHF